MNVIITQQESKTIIEIDGRIDTTNAKEFEQQIDSVLKTEMTDVEIDCEKLTYISSSGLRVFLLLQKNANAKKGHIILKNLNSTILEVFKMTGFSSIFEIV